MKITYKDFKRFHKEMKRLLFYFTIYVYATNILVKNDRWSNYFDGLA